MLFFPAKRGREKGNDLYIMHDGTFYAFVVPQQFSRMPSENSQYINGMDFCLPSLSIYIFLYLLPCVGLSVLTTHKYIFLLVMLIFRIHQNKK